MLVALLAAGSCAWAQPFGYSINSRGNMLDDSRVFALWRIDLASGEETYIGWTGQGDFIDIEGLAFSPDESLFGADDSTHTLVRIGTSTGNAIPVGGAASNMGIPTGTSMDFGLTFTCEGDLLASSAGEEKLYRGDPSTGELELIGALDVPIVDMTSVGETIYGIGLGTDGAGNPLAPNLYRIDAQEAAAELIGPLGSQASPYIQAGLAADEAGNLWAITDRNRVGGSNNELPSEILEIDPASGAATRVAETIVGIESLAIVPPGDCDRGEPMAAEAIPVMSSAARWLFALSLAGLAAFQLRRVSG